jgi:hypothetical protein
VTRLSNLRADQVLDVNVPKPVVAQSPTAASPHVAGCRRLGLGSAARLWEQVAVDAIGRPSGASEPAEARDLYDVSVAMYDAWKATKSAEAVSYAAYRVLLWRASFESNLAVTFERLTGAMKDQCLSIDYTSTSADTPAAVGNRIAATVIAAGTHDGSNEALHYADPSYTPENAPLILAQYGSTVHDPTFWQPLALTQIAPKGIQGLPGDIQAFEASQWGDVKTFAGKVAAQKPHFDTTEALAVIRATSSKNPGPAVRQNRRPSDWVELAATEHASTGLASDVHLYLELTGALNDAAVSAWAAKRQYQAPRPISMIRYLAFNDQLPLTPGLVEKKGSKIYVLERGKWVLGGSWTPPGATPASPGGISEGAAFAAAAEQVLGPSVARYAALSERAGLVLGIETPSDEAAGRAVGIKVGALAVAKARRLFR